MLDRARFIRTTWSLVAKERIDIPSLALSIRKISAIESADLAMRARKRNVFARHSWENNFYVERLSSLSESTAIEVFTEGPLNHAMKSAADLVDVVEKVVLLSAVLGLSRGEMQRLLAISPHRRFGFDFGISQNFEYLRSSSRREVLLKGILIDERYVRRFHRCGFTTLIEVCISNHSIASRLLTSLGWLWESRQDPETSAALVKTTIASEALLIMNDSEQLRGPLSERTAFLLSEDPATRARISKAVKMVYDTRSRIVHGGHKRNLKLPIGILEGMDRLTLLLLLTLAANSTFWPTQDDLAVWCENQRWGTKSIKIIRPFPSIYLQRSLTQIIDNK